MKFLLILLVAHLLVAKPLAKQELVGKIIDLIKREQIKLNLIEDEESTTLINHDTILEEVEGLFAKNSEAEVEEAVNVVSETMKVEPVFSKQIQDDSTTSTTTTPAPSLEDIMVQVYTALPKDVQDTVKTGYEMAVESYNNITVSLKREWYNFQVGTNQFLTDIFGDEQVETNQVEKVDKKPADTSLKRPGESTVTIFDVVTNFFEKLVTSFFSPTSRGPIIRIFKRSTSVKA